MKKIKKRRSLSSRTKDFKLNLSKKHLKSYRPLKSKTTVKLETDLDSPDLSPLRKPRRDSTVGKLESIEEKKHKKFIKNLGFLRSDVERGKYLKYFSSKLMSREEIFGRKQKSQKEILEETFIKKGQAAQKKMRSSPQTANNRPK